MIISPCNSRPFEYLRQVNSTLLRSDLTQWTVPCCAYHRLLGLQSMTVPGQGEWQTTTSERRPLVLRQHHEGLIQCVVQATPLSIYSRDRDVIMETLTVAYDWKKTKGNTRGRFLRRRRIQTSVGLLLYSELAREYNFGRRMSYGGSNI